MNSILAIAGIAFGLALLTQIVTKLVVNTKEQKEQKEKVKEMRKEMKELEPDSDEFKDKQQEMMKVNMSMMKESFKPTLVTIIPFILVISWMGGVYSHEPIQMGQEVQVEVSGNGKVISECLGLNETVNESFETDAKVSSEDCKASLSGTNVSIPMGAGEVVKKNTGEMDMKVKPPELELIPLPFSLPYIGDSLGWLGTFIVFSLMFSFGLKKSLEDIHLKGLSLERE